eukprot:TRINITY_DN2062_c0_g1_i1.p1 TRINITY_DN2062_c0_g1~~TRINITY_DN2062_c0_g1_i1.p1  ORF type:complete len:1073 (-),score=287.97 TRINITY_DN2062_c0_g1_i1:71-3289(-)
MSISSVPQRSIRSALPILARTSTFGNSAVRPLTLVTSTESKESSVLQNRFYGVPFVSRAFHTENRPLQAEAASVNHMAPRSYYTGKGEMNFQEVQRVLRDRRNQLEQEISQQDYLGAKKTLVRLYESGKLLEPSVWNHIVFSLAKQAKDSGDKTKLNEAYHLLVLMHKHAITKEIQTFDQLLRAAVRLGDRKKMEDISKFMDQTPNVHPVHLLKCNPPKYQQPDEYDGLVTIPHDVDPVLAVKPRTALKYHVSSVLEGVEDVKVPFFEENRDDEALLKKQEEFEMEATTQAMEQYKQYKDMINKLGRASTVSQGRELMTAWFEEMKNRVETEQELINAGKSTWPGLNRYGSYFNMLDPDKMAVITIHTVLGMLVSKNKRATIRSMAAGIADGLQAEITMSRLKIEESGIFKFAKKNRGSMYKVKLTGKFHLEDGSWSPKVSSAVGQALVDMLVDVAKFYNKQTKEKEPAILKGQKTAGDNSFTGHVELSHELKDLLSNDSGLLANMIHARHFPMLCEPKPWEGPKIGGYLRHDNYIMRTKGVKVHKSVIDSHGRMEKIYEGLNALAQVPWSVNQRVLEVIAQAWDNGGGIGELPPRKDYELPMEPDDPEKKYEWRRSFKKVTAMNRDLKGLRCDTTYKLDVAYKMWDMPKFYFPHTMDFRGRTYPVPPHLNHLGADINRSLLLFYHGKPLGTRGLQWLKIHLSNLYGHDKISFTDRIGFVEHHLNDIFDSADKPLNGNRWWLNAEEPWQCLSACMELTNALRSPNPENYISHLPVHQDGTCNGLQHYAALGGDVFGGQEVNLLPAPFPQDVYSTVAALVRKRVDADAKDGHPEALLLQGKIERKIVKQTVMTSVYGVTFIGARQQIQNAMKDKGTCRDEDLWRASAYIAKLTFASLKEMFKGARAIMDWLGQCARLIAKGGHIVKWRTPLGLAVVQPYWKAGKGQVVKTLVQNVSLQREEEMNINVNKQKTAFPPNYVHSLDSSHMFLTAIEMAKRNLTYASVHDSYWTHAATVDEMNVILREKFVELHKEPILERLKEFFETEYPNVVLPEVPERGDLDLEKVKASPYFFN